MISCHPNIKVELLAQKRSDGKISGLNLFFLGLNQRILLLGLLHIFFFLAVAAPWKGSPTGKIITEDGH
jgi:hypothetical protein